MYVYVEPWFVRMVQRSNNGKAVAGGKQAVIGKVFVEQKEIERVEHVFLGGFFAEYNQMAEHELGIPTRFAVDFFKRFRNGVAAADKLNRFRNMSEDDPEYEALKEELEAVLIFPQEAEEYDPEENSGMLS